MNREVTPIVKIQNIYTMKNIFKITAYIIFLAAVPFMGLLFLAVGIHSWWPALLWALILIGGNVYMMYKNEQPECDLYNPL